VQVYSVFGVYGFKDKAVVI